MPTTVPPRVPLGLALTLLLPALALADGERPAPKANHRLANKFSAMNVASRSYSTGVAPHWIGKSDEFWYEYRTSEGAAFWRVDPAQKTKRPLFDRETLAGKLAELSRKPVDAETMNLKRGRVSDDGSRFSFVFAETLYEYDMKNDALKSNGPAPKANEFPGGKGKRRAMEDSSAFDDGMGDEAQDTDKTKEEKKDEGEKKEDGRPERAVAVASPDRGSVLMVKDYDLYLGKAGKEKEAKRLTTGGGEDYGFSISSGFGFGGGGTRGGGGVGASQRSSNWSKESKFFYATRRDRRNVKELFVVNSLPSKTSNRPSLLKYKYPMPGEEAVGKGELYAGVVGGAFAQVPAKWTDEMYFFVHWAKEGELRFLRMDRLRRNVEFCAHDVATGKTRVLIAEGFDNANLEYDLPEYHPVYLENGEGMLWWTERSGWGHWQLHDREGKRKNALTSGPWRAGRIVGLDEQSRTLYVRGYAREKGENPYYQHLYSVELDGTHLTLLDPGDAHQHSFLSPSRRFVVSTSSRVDECPVSVLRDGRGGKVMDLETTDLSKLKEYGWGFPETFTVKAADGITDLYGNLWKPFDFDPKKSYPVIAHVYPGPQQEGVTHTFSAYNSFSHTFGIPYSSNMQLAQLGFVVIQVGHRGGSPMRSKAYASFGYFNLRDYGLVDKKHAIEQLAARFAWIDLKQVGIYGHSGGGFMSAAALLQKPYNDFFKAAVASAGNHDNNIYNNSWSEKYHGLKEIKEEVKDMTKRPEEPAAPPAKAKQTETNPPKKDGPAAPPVRTKFDIKVPTNAELAANLKGRLLLVHGEADSNVHPANTMRLVDALIKANKRFDMLMLPGQNHVFLGEYGVYFRRRMMEFFAEHLLGDRRGGADLDGD